MSAERLTSWAEMYDIKTVLDAAVDELILQGFGPSQIGASMVGIGGSLLCKGSGKDGAIKCLNGTITAIEAYGVVPN